MALPVAPPPKSNDIAAVGWAGLTVRIAWTLLVQGVKVRPEVLRDARNHVLFHLDPGTSLPHAEDLATRLTEEFVARARGHGSTDPWAGDWEMPLSPRWRLAVDRSLDPASEVVFRKHYGDDKTQNWLEQHLQLEGAAVEALRHGLREVVREIALADGLPFDGWSPERVDRVLRRIAAYAPGPCPPVLDVAEGCHRDHVSTCARCDRTVRLLQSGVFAVDDLFPPTVGARPHGRTRVLALHLHPDGRRARRRLIEELGVPAFAINDDLILVEPSDPERVMRVLTVAAEVGAPARVHLRGVLQEGPGAWTPRGLVGPLVDRATREVLHRSWGAIDGLGELPEVLPEPPSARGWWAAAFATLALAVALAVGVATHEIGSPATRPPPVSVEFTPGRGGTWAAFDVPERAVVTVVAERLGALVPVVTPSSPVDKAALATGDGSFRVHVVGDGVLLAVTDAPVDLGPLLKQANAQAQPLSALASALAGRGEVRWYRR